MINLSNILSASRQRMVSKEFSNNFRLNEKLIDFFLANLEKVANGSRGLISEEQDITTVSAGKVLDFAECLNSSVIEIGNKCADKVCIVKLNGGLGTSMGLKKAKSLLKVKNNTSFIDIIVRQVLSLRSEYKIDMPLFFLNSFSTQGDTMEYLKKAFPDFKNTSFPMGLMQNAFPKISQDTLLPTKHPIEDLNWNPPGHGDIYIVLQSSGLLDQLLERGYKYVFISNADNLGATFHPGIIGLMEAKSIPFMMESSVRTEADKKGGHLAEDQKTKGLVLRESANCPENEKVSFSDINKWQYFNTNNLWVNIEELKAVLSENNGIMPLDLIVNPKKNNPQQSKTPDDNVDVFQLETAMGSAIRYFKGAKALRIDRNKRFFPVKKINDLFLLKSDAISINSKGHIALNGRLEKPIIDLDSSVYKTVGDLDALCPYGVPSLQKCDHLTVVGVYRFGQNEVLAGDIFLSNN